MSNENVVFPLTIFYDDSCPLCRAEMNEIKRCDSRDRLHLLDCSKAGFCDATAAGKGILRDDMMRLIHARDASGRWLVGVEVFIAVYRAIGIESVARMFESSTLRPFWDRFYPWIARHRMALSRLGITQVFAVCVGWAARRAQRRMGGCVDRNCVSATVD